MLLLSLYRDMSPAVLNVSARWGVAERCFVLEEIGTRAEMRSSSCPVVVVGSKRGPKEPVANLSSPEGAAGSLVAGTLQG